MKTKIYQSPKLTSEGIDVLKSDVFNDPSGFQKGDWDAFATYN